MKNYLFIFLFSISLCDVARAQGCWIQRANFAGPARHRTAAAAVGNHGYIGLGHINAIVDVLFDDWFEYDPSSDSWTQKANYGGGPRMHPATFVIDGKIYVGTGRDTSQTLHQDFWCYDPVTNMWTSIADFPGAARRGAVAFTINGLGYVGTGSYHSNFFKYDPASDSWSNVAPLPGPGRISCVACAINGKGYLSTGDNGSGATGDIWEYDPAFDNWTMKANLPGLPRMEAGGFALNGKFYVGCGDDMPSGTNYGDFWCYDPPTDSWSQVCDFTGIARRYPASFVIGTHAYLGLGTNGTNFSDLWETGILIGVNEIQPEISFSISPNPVIDNAVISFGKNIPDGTFEILDEQGKLIRAVKFSGNEFDFSREGISSGNYFIRIRESQKTSVTKKIIIN